MTDWTRHGWRNQHLANAYYAMGAVNDPAMLDEVAEIMKRIEALDVREKSDEAEV